MRGVFVVGVSPMDGLGQMVNPHEPFGRGDVTTHTCETVKECGIIQCMCMLMDGVSGVLEGADVTTHTCEK